MNKCLFAILFAAGLLAACTNPQGSNSPGTGNTSGNTLPSDVANLTANAGDCQVVLSWNDPGDGNFSKVEVDVNHAKYSNVTKGTQTATVANLTNGAGYTFTVKSISTDSVLSAGVSVTATPMFSVLPGFPVTGFSLQLKSGTFWKFDWKDSKSWNHLFNGSGSSTTSGETTITLGQATTIAGISAYPLQIANTGSSPNFTLKWGYLASKDDRILGSTDGSTLQTIFDGAIGQWEGGGFFTGGSDEKVTTALTSVSNDYFDTSVYSISFTYVSGTSGGIYYPGIGYLPGSSTGTVTAFGEYFKSGIGPLGYHYNMNSYVAGETNIEDLDIGLVDTSLTATDGWLPADQIPLPF